MTLITMDTVGAGHRSLHGYGRQTSPVVEDPARSGIHFDGARAPGPWTLPSPALERLRHRLDEVKQKTVPLAEPAWVGFNGGCACAIGKGNRPPSAGKGRPSASAPRRFLA